MPAISALHVQTPVLNVIEPRGLAARSVSFYRTHVDEVPSDRVDRLVYDVVGRRVSRWDARLWAAANQLPDTPGNVSTVSSLSGQVLFTHSVDAGWSAELLGEGGQRVCRWDGAGHSQRFEFDQLLRPVAVFENDGSRERCLERLIYGGLDKTHANQAGQLIRHDDPAGSVINSAFNLTGQVLEQTRRFLSELAGPDWAESESERDSFLEPGAGATTRWRFNAAGDTGEQTDAAGNTQHFGHTVSGHLKGSRLQLLNQSLQTLVSDIHYDAHKRIEAETLGNGIVTTLDYDPADGRLRNLRADNGCLQDLHYAYDPVGNVVSIEDRAQPTRFFANQQVEPLRTFAYDTLYQLIEATGYESATANQGPSPQSCATANELSNYTHRYEYDAGGNLQKLVHTGARNYTRTFATARYSNRSLLQTGERPPTEEQIAAGFDANGNVRELSPGQTLIWDLRNQLSGVTPVKRESGINDREVYQYDAAGARVRKVRVTQTKELTHLSEVRYLPGLEIRSNSASGEVQHVITGTAGRSNVRVLHWQAGRPTDIENNQARYSLTDHLGSSTLELDHCRKLISQEIYYPYGETAWFAVRSEVEANYKVVCYSGKECDATGLYYYGLRYYVPGLMRWINPDPERENGGLNQFCFCANSPIRYGDLQGEAPYDVLSEQEVRTFEKLGIRPVARGMSEMTFRQKTKVSAAIDIALELLAKTRRELVKEAPGRGVKKAFDALFGDLYEEHESQVISEVDGALKQQQTYLESLKGSSDWKIGIFSAPVQMAGLTRKVSPYEPERTVLLSETNLDNLHVLEVARTLIHEASHATQNTVDVMYFHSPLLKYDAQTSDIESWSAAIRRAARKVLSGGPEEGEESVNVEDYAGVMNDLTKRQTTPEIRRDEFINNPFIRASLLFWNADTYSSLVMSTRLPARVMSTRF